MRKKKEKPVVEDEKKPLLEDSKTPKESVSLIDKKRARLKPENFEIIEMLKDAGGLKAGFQKKLPARLAKQMVSLGHAKIIKTEQ